MNAQEREKAYRVHISVKAPNGDELQGSGHFFTTEKEARSYADWISQPEKTLTKKLLLIGTVLLTWILMLAYYLNK